MITIILHSPEHPGNIGAVARAMANFGFTDLILVNPQCDHLCDEARNRAKHARAVLENAQTGDESLLEGFDLLVATSGKIGNEYNIPRIPVTPEQVVRTIAAREGNTGIMFGRESCGLTNKELQKADILVSIPTRADYPVLNLSHAVSIMLYELSKDKNDQAERFPLANRGQKEELTRVLEELFSHVTFQTPEKQETQRRLWKRVIATITAREAQAMLGFLKKLGSRK